MMDTMESCVPPGFRFHPTDEELVGYYLRKKIASQKIDLDVIRDIDLYRIEPWDLIERCRIGYEEQNEWYFFSHKDKKYPTGTRTNRATIAGFWKATGRDKVVFDKCTLIGMRKTLVFYKGRAPNGQKTDWIMHEYRLESDTKTPSQSKSDLFIDHVKTMSYVQEEGWVVCRAFKKRATSQTKNRETWNSTFLYDHSNSVKSLGDPLPFNCIKRHDVDHDQQEPSSFLNYNLMCKQEADQSEDNIRQFVPQLQSPSLPSLKRPSFCNNYEEQHQQHMVPKRCRTSPINDYTNNKMASTDWRDLDKFVASQLSQEEERSCYHQRAEGKYGDMSNFGGYYYSPDHMELFLSSSHEYREDGNKLHELLNSESSCDWNSHI